MPGIVGVFGAGSEPINQTSLVETIDLLGSSQKHIVAAEDGFLALATVDAALMTSAYYEDPDYIVCLCGYMLDPDPIPWRALADNCRSRSYAELAQLRGHFAIIVYDKPNQRVYVISDLTSQHPVYYSLSDNRLVVSSAMSTFTRLPRPPVFNRAWLYEFLYFNFPIGQTTFVQGVTRMPPASVLCYDLAAKTSTVERYAPPPRHDEAVMKGRPALDRALSVFRQRVPRYFAGDRKNWIGLTAGFDSRPLLALAPANIDLETYTYGVPGGTDLLFAPGIARAVGVPHTSVHFDDAFVAGLSALMRATVRLSNGLQGVNRSSLLHVYRTLAASQQQPPVFITGAMGGEFFRGAGFVPSIISADMKQVFVTGKLGINKDRYAGIFGQNRPEFEQHIGDVLEWLAEQYGKLDSPQAQLSYLGGQVGPKYFAGEGSLANHFGVFRTPYLDTEIADLAFQIEYSFLSFSSFLPQKEDTFREGVLQANLIATNSKLAGIPINGLPLEVFATENRTQFRLQRALKRGGAWLSKRLHAEHVPLIEEWGQWYQGPLRADIDGLLDKNSRIANYVDVAFLKEMVRANDSHWIGKLATAEILLGLIDSRWQD